MIIGRLTRDPEVRTIANGATVCSFGVATNLFWKDASGQRQEKVEFHNVVAWRKLADICGQYLTKGKKVYIEGRLQTREWLGQDGMRRTRTEIIATDMIMLDYGPMAQGANLGNQAANFRPASSTQPAVVPAARPVAPVQSAVKPVEETIPSVSLEEPAGSIQPTMPSEGLSENVVAAATTAEAVKKDEEIKVEDIPF